MRKKLYYAKKTAAICMAATMAFSLGACGDDNSKETTTSAVEEEPDIVFKSASYTINSGLKVVVDSDYTGDATKDFIIQDAEGNVATISDVKVVMNRNINFTFAEALDITKYYTITYGNVTYPIRMPSFYSESWFEDEYTYTGNDLGATYTQAETKFRVWAPTASSVKVNLYESGTDGTDDLIESIDMTSDVNGTWVASKNDDIEGVYYTYSVTVNNVTTEACDPYARATGVNGKRAMVIDLESTNPEGWENDVNPNASLNITDAIIYELHLRDISADASSGIENVGKYLGLTETGTTTSDGYSTGLDYIVDLGVNYVHIMPMYDYGSVDETRLDEAQFNWGYDPVNYNVPEGSYSTDPYDGHVRVEEAKEMVQTLHENGISVIMDVVYNHVYNAEEFCFNQIVPEYFSRVKTSGEYSSGSGCGNDTASERSMVSKYIVDSVCYWADEYHIDGFRFDLVGLIDTDTINEVIEKVHETHPDVIFYGEGWNMKTDMTKNGYTMTTQANSDVVPKFAFFSDNFRDTVRGGNGGTGKGFATGNPSKSSTMSGLVQASAGWSTNPSKIINYSGCHDNNTVFDLITMTNTNATYEEKAAMNKFVAATTITSQGVPFLMNGEELLRTKVNADGTFNGNSYNSSDEVNSIKWSDLSNETVADVHAYYKGLIEFRKAHSGLRMSTAEEVAANLTMLENLPENVIAYTINGGANGEVSNGIVVILNPNTDNVEITLPNGTWNININDEKAGTESLGTVSGTVTVKGGSAMVLTK